MTCKKKLEPPKEFNWEYLKKKFAMGLTDTQVVTLCHMVDVDSSYLASRYCMGLLKNPAGCGFSKECIMSFDSLTRLPAGAYPPEEYFDHLVGPGKFYDIHQSERRIEFKSEKIRKKFSAFYRKRMFDKFLHWIREFRLRGVYNIAHYEVYNLISRFGFPVLNKVNVEPEK